MNNNDQKRSLDEQLEDLKNSGIVKDDEGTYRWVYEMPMLKSFFLLFEVWKVLIIAGLVVTLIGLIINLFSGGGMDGVTGTLQTVGIVLGILLVLSIPAYYIVTRANNGKYTVLFEMNETGIDHVQIKTDKAIALENLTMLVGAAARNRTAMLNGLLAASGTSLYSRFENVRQIRAYPEKNLIKLNSLFTHNQVYAEDEDFDFVLNYIIDHCPNVTVK